MNKPLMLGITIFSISGLFLTGMNYQTATAGPVSEVALLIALLSAVANDENGAVRLVQCTVTTDSGDTIIVGSAISEDFNNGRVIKATIARDENLSSVTVTCLLDNGTTTESVTKEVKKKGTTVIVVTDPSQGTHGPN